MSTLLEQHCRQLLRAYPMNYRRERGEEILGTLLEATPQGRAWPLPRDVAGLAVGGLRARAALNGQRATAENLRVAVLAGVSAFLAYTSVNGLSSAVIMGTAPPGTDSVPPIWLQMLAAALVAAAVAAVWLSGRLLLRLAAVTGAVAAWSLVFPGGRVQLAGLVALAMLGIGGARPAWRWGWPVALAAACTAAASLPGSWPVSGEGDLVLAGIIGVASLLWAVIDARPAVAIGVFLLGLLLPPIVNGVLTVSAQMIPTLVLMVVLAAMAWWLHRQSARVSAGRHPLRPHRPGGDDA